MNELISKLGWVLDKVHGRALLRYGEAQEAVDAFHAWKAAKKRTDDTQLSVDGMTFWLGDQHNDDFDTWEQNDNVLTFTFRDVTYTATIERAE